MPNAIAAPFGNSEVINLTATGVQTLTIDNHETFINGGSVIATGNRTLNLTINPEMKVGARLFIRSRTTATETLISGTGMTGVTIVGVAGKNFMTSYIYDGINYKQLAPAIQID